MNLLCHKCGAAWIKRHAPSRRDRCQKCGTDMRCCRNCRHYDPSVSEQCKERDADPITDKVRSNFCEFFSPKRSGGSSGSRSGNDPSGEGDPTQKLKDLLGI